MQGISGKQGSCRIGKRGRRSKILRVNLAQHQMPRCKPPKAARAVGWNRLSITPVPSLIAATLASRPAGAGFFSRNSCVRRITPPPVPPISCVAGGMAWSGVAGVACGFQACASWIPALLFRILLSNHQANAASSGSSISSTRNRAKGLMSPSTLALSGTAILMSRRFTRTTVHG